MIKSLTKQQVAEDVDVLALKLNGHQRPALKGSNDDILTLSISSNMAFGKIDDDYFTGQMLYLLDGLWSGLLYVEAVTKEAAQVTRDINGQIPAQPYCTSSDTCR